MPCWHPMVHKDKNLLLFSVVYDTISHINMACIHINTEKGGNPYDKRRQSRSKCRDVFIKADEAACTFLFVFEDTDVRPNPT